MRSLTSRTDPGESRRREPRWPPKRRGPDPNQTILVGRVRGIVDFKAGVQHDARSPCFREVFEVYMVDIKLSLE